MSNKIIIGETVKGGKPALIDIDEIIENRMLVQANSGGGKSYFVRKFLEESFGKVQHIVLDPEGEYSTLREAFDYLLVGNKADGAEIQISTKIASMLAKKILELGVDVIIDLYELKMQERKHFVRLFLEALVNAKKELWHPCIVVLDEAHVYAPQSSYGEAESLDAVKDLASRGRKRQFALIACTQRPAKLSKDVTSELNTKFVGRAVQDLDRKRNAEELGWSTKPTETVVFRSLKHQFFGFGPAFSDDVILVQAGEVKTSHESHFKRIKKIIPTPKKIKDMLIKIESIPEEADKEIKTTEEMKAKILEQQRKIVELQRQPINEEDKEKIRYNGYKDGFNKAVMHYENIINQIKQSHTIVKNTLDPAMNQLDSLKVAFEKAEMQFDNIGIKLREHRPFAEEIPQPIQSKLPIPRIEQATIGIVKNNEFEESELGQGPMKILKAIAQFYPKPISIYQAGTMAGYSVGSGTWQQYMSTLRKNELMKKSGKQLTITEKGLSVVGDYEPLPTDPEKLFNMWCDKIGGGPAKILKVLFDNPIPINQELLAEQSGYSFGSGTWQQYISTLRKNHLIERVGDHEFKITSTIFPMEAMN